MLICRFRWVQCQLDYIKTLRRDKDRREALKDLPPGLPETYKRELNRIENPGETDKQIALRALNWLICCERPLKLRELATAIAIIPGNSFNAEEMLDDDDLLLRILGSLVRKNNHSFIIEIAHFSVKDYLTTSDQIPATWYIDVEEGHVLLLESCLTYLSYHRPCDQSDLENDTEHIKIQPQDNDPLREYAAFNWFYHAKKIEHRPGSTILIKKFLCASNTDEYKRWCQSWEKRFDPNLRVTVESKYSGLYYAALFSLPHVVKLILREEPEAVKREAGGAALVGAAREGNSEVISLLLHENVSFDKRTDFGWTALHRATYNNHLCVIVMLLEAGVNPGLSDWGGWTPLHIAVAEGYTDIVRLLLERSETVNETLKENKWSALHLAAQHGHTEITRLLLNAHAGTDLVDINGCNPIHIAALHEKAEVMWAFITHLESQNSLIYEARDRSPEYQLTAWDETESTTTSQKELHGKKSTEMVLLKLVTMFPTDFVFHEALGDYFFRRKRYAEADIAYFVHPSPTPSSVSGIADTRASTHVHYPCQRCREPIMGDRYKCTICYAYNLCENCDTSAHTHNIKEFIMIPNRENVTLCK
jgi:Ankyrin repeats (3 copies)/Zinc finger, ZZ type/Ankyrin repeats (many copies)